MEKPGDTPFLWEPGSMESSLEYEQKSIRRSLWKITPDCRAGNRYNFQPDCQASRKMTGDHYQHPPITQCSEIITNDRPASSI